jgi:hypothetical protein
VWFGDPHVPACEAAVESFGATGIVVRPPAHAAGTVDVYVQNPNGQIGRGRDGFTYTD